MVNRRRGYSRHTDLVRHNGLVGIVLQQKSNESFLRFSIVWKNETVPGNQAALPEAEDLDADLIIMLDDGKIHALGNHQQLIETCERYRDMYESQMRKEALA